MKQLLQQYAGYNVWANQKFIDRVIDLPEELCTKELQSSFSSVQKTLLHLWDAEAIWWQRLKLAEHVNPPSVNFSGSIVELCNNLARSSGQWEDWIINTNELNITHVFAYQNSKKEQFKQPVYEMLLHLFNHQTYHRGQIITMFHELGVEGIPGTDFILYIRSKVPRKKKSE